MQEFAALLLLLLLLCPTARGEEGPVTRGGVVSALWESAGAVPYDAQTPFSDVSPRADYAPAVSWAAHQGLGLGTGEGRFQPERPITREDLSLGGRLPLLGLRRRRAALVPRRTAGPLRHPHPGPDCGYLLRLRPSGQAGIGPCFNALPADQAPGDPVRVPGGLCAARVTPAGRCAGTWTGPAPPAALTPAPCSPRR